MTTTDREIETIAFYAAQLAALAADLRAARKDRDAYGQALHDLGAKVAGLQKTLLDAEHERDLLRGFELARTRMADATRPAPPCDLVTVGPDGVAREIHGWPKSKTRAPCAGAVHKHISVTTDGDVLCHDCGIVMKREPAETREGTGAAPSAAVDPAQRVTAPETPTRTEPAGRSVESNPQQKEAESQAAQSGAGTPAEVALDGAQTANDDAGATPAPKESEQRAEQGPGAPAEQEPAAGELSDETIPYVPATGGEWKAGAPYTVGERVVPCVFPARAARGATPAPPPDPFLDGAPSPDREEPKHEPWWRYAVGPPKGAYHLFCAAECAEAECGETTDDETRPAPNLPPYEQTCMDCMDLAAQRGIKVPVCADEAPAVAAQPEPPEAADAEEPADESAPPVRKKYARKPRTCVVPGCGRPGHSATNEFGAKTSGGLWCDEHAKALTAEERRDLHARDKRARKAAKQAKAGEAAA